MSYYVSWSMFIDCDDPDPLAVAAKARNNIESADHQAWTVINLDDGTTTVVDLTESKVIS